MLESLFYPGLVAFFSSILGGTVAYITIVIQERNSLKRVQVASINKCVLYADDAFQNLLAIKRNYHNKINSDPIQRAVHIPRMLFDESNIDYDYSALSFISPKSKELNLIPHKWSQIPRIRAMFKNYNYLLVLWDKRNQLISPIVDTLISSRGSAFRDISNTEILSLISNASIGELIDINEHTIILTDAIITELHDFLNNFSPFAKSTLTPFDPIKHGRILEFSFEKNQTIEDILVQSPTTDFRSVCSIFGVTDASILEDRYKTGYEQ